MTDPQWTRTDEEFVRDLVESDKDVEVVARWIEMRGLPAKTLGLAIRPCVEDRDDYNDGGIDLLVGRFHVQVKHRSINFDSKAAFPYASIIVDAVDQLPRHNQNLPVHFYVLVNRDRTAALAISCSTRVAWKKLTRYDSTRNATREFLACPIKFALDFDEWIRKIKPYVPRLARGGRNP